MLCYSEIFYALDWFFVCYDDCQDNPEVELGYIIPILEASFIIPII